MSPQTKKKNTETRRRRRTPIAPGRATAASNQKAATCAGCARVELRLNTLITWIVQSASSPISSYEAELLLNHIGNA